MKTYTAYDVLYIVLLLYHLCSIIMLLLNIHLLEFKFFDIV